MSCYHPIYAVRIGTKENGKADLRMLGYRPDDRETYVTWHNHQYPRDALVPLPCGQCVGCRIDYSRQWANRCMLELGYHDSAWFATFTYDDDHVPRTYYPDPETGEAIPALTLKKRDFQLLMKRIRKRFGEDHIRFFMAGEYGSQTFRPHYHAILFGLHLDDLVPYKTVKEADQYYTYYNSPSLQECWPFGYVVVGEVTWESCAYTARYVMKKLKGKEAKFYDSHNIQPEFTLMSRRPGIARQYYDEHPGLYDFDFINISTPKGGKRFRPPRYFDKLFEIDFPEKSAELKALRAKLAREAQEARLASTSLQSDELMQVQEDKLSNRLKSLRRSL